MMAVQDGHQGKSRSGSWRKGHACIELVSHISCELHKQIVCGHKFMLIFPVHQGIIDVINDPSRRSKRYVRMGRAAQVAHLA